MKLSQSKSIAFKFSLASFLLVLSGISPAAVITHIHHDGKVPVATAVEVKSDSKLVFFSGRLPKLVNPSLSADSSEGYGGDTKSQTIRVLNDIESSLHSIGLTMDDIIKVQVFLVGVPELNNYMDSDGFSEAYAQFFSAGKKTLPSRTLVQVSNLAKPGMLVEIEVTALRK